MDFNRTGGVNDPLKLNKKRVNLIIMPAKGTAAKSASGSSMSQYDVELDKRIKTIEDKLNILINCLNENSYVNQNFPKNSEGKRELSL